MVRVLVFVLRLLARMPLGVLYLMADVVYVLMFCVVRYRRKLVRKNLVVSFPEKTKHEIRAIERRYYRNFADYMVETIKLLHVSDEQMCRRMRFEGLDIISRYMKDGKSVAAYFSHCFNWEWAPSITLHLKDEFMSGDVFAQIYRPLRNEGFDALMLKLRGRFGSESIAKRTALRHFVDWKRRGVISVTGFMSDQKPSAGDDVHVVEFLNHPTAVITGTEQLARRLGMAAVYWDIQKVKRGHYVITVRKLADDVSKTAPMAVTDTYFKMLEQTIRRQPEIWLWTHNRWKHPVTLPLMTPRTVRIDNKQEL